MRTIYYITRTMAPHQSGGGPQMRSATVTELRRLGWRVVVVMPNYRGAKIEESNSLIKVPVLSLLKVNQTLERLGIIEDYLSFWAFNVINYLKQIVNKNDIIFCTSGGELATLKIGSQLKQICGTNYVANFRDPVHHTTVHGIKQTDKFYVARDHILRRYLENADLVLTSSLSYAEHITHDCSLSTNIVIPNLFGFHSNATPKRLSNFNKDQIVVGYMGTMTPTQSPENLIEAYIGLPKTQRNKIKLMFIGAHQQYKPFDDYRGYDGIEFIDFMPIDELNELVERQIDVGYVSLSHPYYGVCIPSKIYEYINSGLPILGALPNGDALNIVNENNFGLAGQFNDREKLRENLVKFTNDDFYRSVHTDILLNRNQWSLKVRIDELDEVLKNAFKK